MARGTESRRWWGVLLLPDESPEVIAGEIDQVRSSSQPGSFGPDDRLRLDGLAETRCKGVCKLLRPACAVGASQIRERRASTVRG
jgi:hypothetical protein